MSPKVQITLDEERVLHLFAGGNHMAKRGDNMGLNVALNALSQATLDLRLLGELVGSDMSDRCYSELDLANRIHWLMYQLEAAIALAQALQDQTCAGTDREVQS